MSFITRLQPMLRGMLFLASSVTCDAAPFLLNFRFFDFDGAPGTTILLEVPSLPVASGSLPISFVRDLEISTAGYIFPDPMVTEITRNFVPNPGNEQELWTFLIENDQGVSILFSNLLGFGGEITGPGTRLDTGNAQVQNLFFQLGDDIFEVERGGSGNIVLTITDVPEPGSLGAVCLGLMLIGGFYVSRRDCRGVNRPGSF
jgi:hypothetical protein